MKDATSGTKDADAHRAEIHGPYPAPDQEELTEEQILTRALAMDHEDLAIAFSAAVIAVPVIGKERDEARAQLAHVIDEMERLALRAESAEAEMNDVAVERDKFEADLADSNAAIKGYEAGEGIKIREIRAWHMATTEKDAEGNCIAESGECSLCGILDCAYDDPLHYHHDGCPSEYCPSHENIPK